VNILPESRKRRNEPCLDSNPKAEGAVDQTHREGYSGRRPWTIKGRCRILSPRDYVVEEGQETFPRLTFPRAKGRNASEGRNEEGPGVGNL